MMSPGSHTGLTPSMSKMYSGENFASSSSRSSMVDIGDGGDACHVRGMVQNCLANGINGTACILADRLLRIKDSTLSDIILFARCFQAKGEPRRCLAVLEHKGLLSAKAITNLSDVLSPKAHSTIIPIIFYDFLDAIHLAAQCLFSLEQHDDCVHLLDPIMSIDNGDESVANAAAKRARHVCRGGGNTNTNGNGNDVHNNSKVNVMASIYCIVGKCHDILENKPRAIACLTTSIQVDPACTESLEYLIENGMVSKPEKRRIYETLLDGHLEGREWLEVYYRFQLLDEVSEETERDLLGVVQDGPQAYGLDLDQPGIDMRLSSIVLVKRAECLYENQYPAESYRLARQAYIMDPFDTKGLLVYIASMVELNLTTELFYLGHELSKTYPKQATSWYAVGCYYWICKKLEHAQKYLQKAIKLNKRFVQAWIALGHVLAAQEESEHAISAFRTASRLLPGDHRPLMYMAKELVRTNYLSLALHLLFGALRIRPQDPSVLNELGVVYMKQDRLKEALDHLSLAASIIQASTDGSNEDFVAISSTGKVCGDEIFSNYATALRQSKRFEEALEWYQLCLTMNPSDADTHANMAFTLHLSGRYTEAIDEYHKALALQPNFSFCSEMLLRAMEDYSSNSEYLDSTVNDYPSHLVFDDLEGMNGEGEQTGQAWEAKS
jgi:anaphase-promoting complex subunit 6